MSDKAIYDRVRQEFAIHAPRHDERAPADTDAFVRFVLARAPKPARVLEFGVGSGRMAAPLVRAGVAVTGIDLSEEMLAQLKLRPEAARMTILAASFTEPQPVGPFEAVVCVYNTLYHAHSAEQQLAALRRAAEYLAPDGVVILQNTSACWLSRSYGKEDSRVGVRSLGEVGVDLTAGTLSLCDQMLRNIHVHLADGHVSVRPTTMRFVWPAELRLMADAAGLAVVEEFGSWDEQPFTDGSRDHITVLRPSA